MRLNTLYLPHCIQDNSTGVSFLLYAAILYIFKFPDQRHPEFLLPLAVLYGYPILIYPGLFLNK